MVIDFEKIAEAHLEGFKGGKGKLDTRNYVDDKVKIMYSWSGLFSYRTRTSLKKLRFWSYLSKIQNV